MSGITASLEADARVARYPLIWLRAVVAVVVVGMAALVATVLVSTREATLAAEARVLARWAGVLADSTQRVFFDAALLSAGLTEELAELGVKTREDFARVAASREMHDWMRDALLISSVADAVGLIDATGNLVNTSLRYPAPAANLSDRQYFSRLRDHPELAFVIDDPGRSRVTQSDAMFMAHRVSGPRGEFLGLVAAVIHTARLKRNFDKAFAGENFTVSLSRRAGPVLLRYPGPGAGERSAEVNRVVNEALDRADGGTLHVRQADSEGPARLLAFQALSGYALVITVSRPESLALAAWRAQAVWIIGTSAGAAALVVLLGWMLVRQWRLRLAAFESARLRDVNAELEARVHRRTEELQSARDEAERANRAKTEFLSSMSHELRTPLNAVLGFSHLLEVDGNPRLSERQLGFVRHIHRSGKHLLELIGEVLDLARIEAQRMTVSLEPVALHALVEDCCALVEPQLGSSGLSLEAELPPADWHAHADRTRARQALLNLLSNATKFNRKDGKVRVCVERHAEHFKIVVEDTGRGLTPEQVKRLFVPFERLDEGPGQIEGTGIGLALSKRLVELMSGRMGVESEPGVGSRFWLELPVSRAQALAGQARAAAPPPADAAPAAATDTPQPAQCAGSRTAGFAAYLTKPVGSAPFDRAVATDWRPGATAAAEKP